MEIEGSKPTEEQSGTRQELLNNIYTRSLNLPIMDIELNNDDELVAIKFNHHFQEGTTTSGFTDQLSVKFSLKDEKIDIFYAKGIFATRITLKKNLETQNADLLKYVVFRKDNQEKGREGFSMVPALSISGEPLKPYLHAVVSLLDETENKIKADSKYLKVKIETEEDRTKATLRKAGKLAKAQIAKKQKIKDETRRTLEIRKRENTTYKWVRGTLEARLAKEQIIQSEKTRSKEEKNTGIEKIRKVLYGRDINNIKKKGKK